MVNYRRILWESAAVCAILAIAASAPAADSNNDHYDLRQNGSENIRVHVDGVVLAVFPAETIAESLLSVVPDLSDLLDVDDFGDFQKPKPPVSPKPPKEPVSTPKPEEKPHEAPQKPQSEFEKPQLEADKPASIEPSSTKSTEAPLSDVSLNSEISKEKKPLTSEQKKALRLKKIFGNLLVPFMRKNRHH